MSDKLTDDEGAKPARGVSREELERLNAEALRRGRASIESFRNTIRKLSTQR